MNYLRLMLAVVATLTAGCANDPRAPTRDNFERAVSTKLSSSNANLCIDSPVLPARMLTRSVTPDFEFHIIGTEPSGYNSEQESQYRALASAALAVEKSATVIAKRDRFFSTPAATKTVAVLQFSPTPLFAKYEKANTTNMFGSSQQLCYATLALDHVTNWTVPGDVMGMHVTTVSFAGKVNDVAPWASNSTMRANFPELKKLDTLGSTEQQMVLVLTANGWESS